MMGTDLPPAADYIPDDATLEDMAEAVDHCRACPLWENATQGVFGEGPKTARVMLVGEQPGDREDLAGRPFVGPAGQVLDEALEEVGIPRAEVYVTNAVKHFKHEERGQRRIHRTPTLTEARACKPWLEREIARVKPQVLVALGSTAAKSLFGAEFRVTKQRGEPVDTDWAPFALATYHPSALLRMPEEDMRRQAREAFVADLGRVAERMRVRGSIGPDIPKKRRPS
jgi:uracil-DNA glycosylase